MGVSRLKVTAPGRICLFGEHQDYLSLPVITAAINLRLTIEGEQRTDRIFHIKLPDIQQTDQFEITSDIGYIKKRDYLRSAVNILTRNGVQFPGGYNCIVRSEIPINSGSGSSSALVVAWIKFLLTIAEDHRANNPFQIANLAHQAEVLEFGEPGGKMDHFASSLGKIQYIDFENVTKFHQLSAELGTFVLGDSLESKDTESILKRVKGGVSTAIDKLSAKQDIALRYFEISKLREFNGILNDEQIELLTATFLNRDLTQKAYYQFMDAKMSPRNLGKLLTESHTILRDKLKISTPKIDNMISSAIVAGATGGKINGSGGGGCMFVNTPQHPDKIAKAITRAGGKPYIVTIDSGARTEYILKG
ncbi:MAG TPA: GHMP kinase [bacterium]|nr:GHMP kinase [bacterium]